MQGQPSLRTSNTFKSHDIFGVSSAPTAQPSARASNIG